MPGWDSRHRPVANKPWVSVLYHQHLLGSVAELVRSHPPSTIHTQVLTPAIRGLHVFLTLSGSLQFDAASPSFWACLLSCDCHVHRCTFHSKARSHMRKEQISGTFVVQNRCLCLSMWHLIRHLWKLINMCVEITSLLSGACSASPPTMAQVQY